MHRSGCVGVREKKVWGFYPSSLHSNHSLGILGCCAYLWQNTLHQWASPPFLLGWEAWKTCKQAPRFEPRGDRGSHVRRQEPCSPKEAAQSPEQIPQCHRLAAGWDVGLPPSPASTQRGTASRRPTGHMDSQRGNTTADPTYCRPFPMHTYLERAV